MPSHNSTSLLSSQQFLFTLGSRLRDFCDKKVPIKTLKFESFRKLKKKLVQKIRQMKWKYLKDQKCDLTRKNVIETLLTVCCRLKIHSAFGSPSVSIRKVLSVQEWRGHRFSTRKANTYIVCDFTSKSIWYVNFP